MISMTLIGTLLIISCRCTWINQSLVINQCPQLTNNLENHKLQTNLPLGMQSGLNNIFYFLFIIDIYGHFSKNFFLNIKRFLISDVTYGGRVTDDWDRRLLNVYATSFFNDRILFEEKPKLGDLS